MKNTIGKILFFLLVLFLSPACENDNSDFDTSGEHNLTNQEISKYSMAADKVQMSNITIDLMKNTTDKVKSIKITGDIDIDFAHTMILHHQSGINFSTAEIENGTDVKIKKIALGIITAQKKEIGKMTDYLKDYMLTNGKIKITESKGKLSEIMISMITGINQIKMTWNTDKDFAALMIHHHESAVEMAKEELLHGKQKMLQKIATKMIAYKNTEIRTLKLWVNAKTRQTLFCATDSTTFLLFCQPPHGGHRKKKPK